MTQYKDSLGHIYNVPDDKVEEFERRREVCLKIAVAGQLLILAGLIALNWLI
jgi:hypothetical protein